ncbi:class I SAM-dependent methyltransferase [Micromonospora sp. NPDC047670]|uniref:class I SAM-dependent methyltransferase n=1 Tax=Micromonospora sp. NPDC047670 TaxID=3364252 RepID=UPI003723BC9A
MFGPEHAEVYEAAYRGRGKSWHAEATDVADRILAARPGAARLLDVGCGTGAHLETFATRFPHVEGLELAPAMLALARPRLPGVRLHAGDMREFDLDATFDAVTCLFTAVNFLGTVGEMRAAVARMSAHLAPGGVLVLEPWWFPERFIDGYVGGDLVREEGRTVARVSRSTRQGRVTRMEERWLVGDAAGIREFSQVGLLTMFTREEYDAAFADAGCEAAYVEGWLTGRGLFVATRTGGSATPSMG